MTRLFTLTTVKNDQMVSITHAGMITYLNPYAVFYYDDQCTDDTMTIVNEVSRMIPRPPTYVARRPDDVPTFMEHEGQFRQAALDAMVQRCGLRDDDWVFVLDSDELVEFGGGGDDFSDVSSRVKSDIDEAMKVGQYAIRFPIYTIWGFPEDETNASVLCRVDEPWNTINEPRLWRYREGAQFDNVAMACGNAPTYVARSPIRECSEGLCILHYGYATPAQRKMRYERYSSLDNHGHLPAFIESIMDEDEKVELRQWP